MQIFKYIKKQRKCQNIVEFVLIFPLVIIITLVIFEVALFWQDVNAVYNLNAEINSNIALVDNSGLAMGETCPSATKALDILEKRDSMITQTKESNYTKTIIDGQEPFSLYKYSTNDVTIKDNNGETKPQISMWVDCRSPFEEGITTQVEFYHKTLIMKASIPNFSDADNPIVIIPDNIFIASPKLNTTKQF